MKIKVLILDDNYVDRNNSIMPTNADILFFEDITLTTDFSKPIGNAKLSREGNEFYIQKIQLIDEFKEQMLLLVPAVGGSLLERKGNVYTKFKINIVNLQINPNADDRILSIGEQLNLQKKKGLTDNEEYDKLPTDKEDIEE
jgi:hypothetical protein